MEIVGAALQGHALTQGISPFEKRAGAVEWHTSRFVRTERPSSTTGNENMVMGARTVKVRTTRRMIDTHFMFEL
jgi:hypothetical protein